MRFTVRGRGGISASVSEGDEKHKRRLYGVWAISGDAAYGLQDIEIECSPV